MKKIALLDYGSGNLHSVAKALELAGGEVSLVSRADQLEQASALVVPGVGAFAACMAGIRAQGADELILNWIAAGRKLLGICVGHQVLFESGDEHGIVTAGLGVFSGQVTKLNAQRLPHMGWNEVTFPELAPFTNVVGQRCYFVHSYAAHSDVPDCEIAWAQHEDDRFIAAIHKDGITATQFHPEKSGQAGLQLLHDWLMH